MKMKFISAAAVVFQFIFVGNYAAAGALKRDLNKEGGHIDARADAKAGAGDASGSTGADGGATTANTGADTSVTVPAEAAANVPSEVSAPGDAISGGSSGESTEAPAKKIEGDPVVARVGRKEFRRSDVLAAMASLPQHLSTSIPRDRLFQMVSDQKVAEYLMTEQAKKAGLEKTKEYIDRLDQMKQDLLARLFLTLEITPKTHNEQVLRARHIKYVAEFVKMKESHLYHIMVATAEEAQKALGELKNGGDFSKIAEQHSVAPSKKKGGDEGFIPIDALPDAIKGKLTVLNSGEYTKEAIKTEAGYHIFKITETRDSVPMKFEESKEMLQQMIFQEELTKLMDRLEKQYNVVKYQEDGTSMKTAGPTPVPANGAAQGGSAEPAPAVVPDVPVVVSPTAQ
ncbi:MAG: peptidylprolyl isomerase [Holosporaceae bacterium]|jgi:peptidyl-prolyl cis-trans isomerase C|nr:peptidylprolyl isomerase [Holosporaceae bacterium]